MITEDELIKMGFQHYSSIENTNVMHGKGLEITLDPVSIRIRKIGSGCSMVHQPRGNYSRHRLRSLIIGLNIKNQ